MAIEKVISIKVAGTNEVVQIEQAVSKTNQSTEKLTRSQKELENAITSGAKKGISSTESFKKATDKAITSINNEKEATRSLNEVKEQSAKANEENAELINQLDSATGGYIGKFKELQSGLKAGIGLFKGLKIAIAGTGIGLLVIAVASLVAYFKQSEEGGAKLAKMMSYFEVITKSLTGILVKLGEAIVWAFENPKEAITKLGQMIKENFVNRITGLIELIPKLGNAMELVFKGKFKEAGQVATNALGKVVTGQNDIIGKFGEMAEAGRKWTQEMQNQAQIVRQIMRDRADALKIDNQYIIDSAKGNRMLAELRDKASDADRYSSKQRIGYLRQANEVEQELIKSRMKSTALQLNAMQAENKQNKINREDSKEQLELEAEIINLKAQSEQANRSLASSIGSIRKADAELARSRAEQAKALSDKAKEDRKAQEEKILQEKQAELNKLLQLEENATKAIEDLNAKTAQQRLDLEKDRMLKQLEQVVASEEEKANALLEINSLFLLKQKELDEENQKEADLKTKERELKAIEEKEKMLEDLQLTEDERRQIIDNIDQMILDSTQLTEEERTALYDKGAKARMRIAEKEAENRLKLYDAIGQGAEVVSGVIGKQTAMGKLLAVASSLINTYTAITGQLSAFSGIPIPGYAIAQAIVTGMVGFASVKDILSVKVPNSGGADAGAQAGNVNAPAVNLVGSTDTNQIAETISSQTEQQNENASKPMRAYVVGKDVNSQAELERNAVYTSSF